MRRLDVAVSGTPVAEIWEDERRGHGFRLTPDYLHLPRRPVLGQWFEDRLAKDHSSHPRLHPWFINLLPERGSTMRREIARAGSVDEEDDFGLLDLLGEDLPGNVTLRRSRAQGDLPLLTPTAAHEAIPPGLRASLGGMQLKLTLSGSSKLVLGVRDDEAQWILKLSVAPHLKSLPFNEAAVMAWCSAAGFLVPEVRVLHRDQLPDLGALPPTIEHGFVIRRYDRREHGRRVHQEDFAQVLACLPSAKYDRTDCAGLGIRAAETLGRDGLIEFVRRLVAVVATGNHDAHLKNWALLYPDGQTPMFSPLYDQVATIEYPTLDHKMAMAIGHAKHFHAVDLPSFQALMERWRGSARESESWADFDLSEVVSQTLQRLSESFQPDALGMQPGLAARLREHWACVPLLRRHGLPLR